MWVKYDHHLLTGEKLLVAHLFFLKKRRAVNNNAVPPANPSPYTNIPANNPKYRKEYLACGASDQQTPLKKHSAVQRKWDITG
jgi:hypothetical protein